MRYNRSVMTKRFKKRVLWFALASVVVAMLGALLTENGPQSWQWYGWVIHYSGTTALLVTCIIFVVASVLARHDPQALLESWKESAKLIRWRSPPYVLVLNGQQLGEEEAERILSHRELKILSLENSTVCDHDIKRFVRLRSLTHLNLRRTAITDEGLNHLALLPNLRRVLLAGTQVSPEGVQRFAAALPNCEVNIADT